MHSKQIHKQKFILQNLTEFNTAHNRRVISVADMPDAPNPLKRKHKSTRVGFADEEDVINPGGSHTHEHSLTDS